MPPKELKTIHELALYWQACVRTEETKKKISDNFVSNIANSNILLNPHWESWYHDRRYPEVAAIMEGALDMEIDNVQLSFHEWWAEMKHWINDLENKTRDT